MKKTEATLVSVSATVNRVYLGSLLQTGSYAKFFASAATIRFWVLVLFVCFLKRVSASLAAPYCDFASGALIALAGRASGMALDWAGALLEELARSFAVPPARQLAQLLALMLSPRVAPVISKAAFDDAGKKLCRLARLVPVDGSTPAALMQLIANETGPSQSDDVKSALATLQLKTP